MIKRFLFAGGVILLVLSLAGLVPAFVSSSNELWGMLHLNGPYHWLLSLIALALILSVLLSLAIVRVALTVLAVVFAAWAFLGLVYLDAPIFGVIANGLGNTLLNTALAVLAFFGVSLADEATASPVGSR